MTSWRDEASQLAQADLDRLLDATLPFAQEALEKSGEFFPFGASVSDSGEVVLGFADPASVGEHQASTDVISALVRAFREKRDTIRAAAVVCDVRLNDSDAISVQSEHQEGHCLVAFLPYQKKGLRRGVVYGSLSAARGEPQVWTGE